MLKKVHIDRAVDMEKVAAQTILFQENTFIPSNNPKGIRFMRAINALKKQPMRKILENDATPKKIIESTRLVMGPANEIIPRVLLFPVPTIITPPGEIILTGEMIDSIVISTPLKVNRNSAHNPLY